MSSKLSSKFVVMIAVISLLASSLACASWGKSQDGNPSTEAPTQPPLDPTQEPHPTTPAGHGENIVYKNIAGTDPSLLMLDVYSSWNAQPAPVVIFIHGGTWISGDKSNVQRGSRFVEFFQKNNSVLVSANIRLMQSELSPNTTYHDQASDVASVVRWVRDHISDYGGDPKRIALFGYSSGAHLAALAGTDEQYLQAEGLDLSAIDSVMCFDVDAYDIPRAITEGKDFDYPAAAANLPKFFTTDIETQKAASPMEHIDAAKKHPAFLVVYTGNGPERGGDPQELSRRQSELFVEALRSAGASAVLYGDLNLTHSQLAMQFGDPDFEVTNVAQEFLNEFFW
ncbi:MAG: alpha/beta hydrolase [Chloroflexi bacterium]|nr:alpha/beta hydrolase [Chloroflexota bacterium]